MSDRPGDIDYARLLEVFVEEAGEALEAIEESIATLAESPSDSGAIAEIFRRLHTLKGDAGTVGVPHVGHFTHRLEDLFDRARAQGLAVSERGLALLTDAVDLLREMIDAIPAKLADHQARASEISERLDAATGLLEATTAAVDDTDIRGAERAAASLRVPIARLDALVDLVGELAVARTQFGLRLASDAVSHTELVEMHRAADHLFLGLQGLVLRLRMVPVGPALQRYRRLVRQLAAGLEKKVRLQLLGGDVEVDAGVVARLLDPLSHLLRNAVDHGIEPPAERARLGKSEVGLLTIAVAQEPGHVVVRITDDGRGLDRERLLAKARQLGIAANRIPTAPAEIDRLVFVSGLSTAKLVNQVSGRGVGMDIVLARIESLRGTIAVDNRPGEGASFALRLPLSLAVIDGFHVEVGGDTYVLPIDSVEATTEFAEAHNSAGTGLLSWRDRTLPFLHLRSAFGFPASASKRQIAVIVGAEGSEQAALVVDRVLGQEPTVVKAIARAFESVNGLAGATVLSDGRVALVLQPEELLAPLLARAATAAPTTTAHHP
jgi:two-component system, chemotaxis family, sensor kinase CheA